MKANALAIGWNRKWRGRRLLGIGTAQCNNQPFVLDIQDFSGAFDRLFRRRPGAREFHECGGGAVFVFGNRRFRGRKEPSQGGHWAILGKWKCQCEKDETKERDGDFALRGGFDLEGVFEPNVAVGIGPEELHSAWRQHVEDDVGRVADRERGGESGDFDWGDF